MGALGPRLSTVTSNLGISLPAGGGWAVVHTLQNRVLSVLRPNAQHMVTRSCAIIQLLDKLELSLQFFEAS